MILLDKRVRFVSVCPFKTLTQISSYTINNFINKNTIEAQQSNSLKFLLNNQPLLMIQHLQLLWWLPPLDSKVLNIFLYFERPVLVFLYASAQLLCSQISAKLMLNFLNCIPNQCFFRTKLLNYETELLVPIILQIYALSALYKHMLDRPPEFLN